MIKSIVSKKYLNDVAQYYRDETDRKITALGETPDEAEVLKLNEEGANQALKNISYLLLLGPKKQFKLGITNGVGWREGFTKSPLEIRKAKRRKKNNNRHKEIKRQIRNK